jgi:hypothetical protein
MDEPRQPPRGLRGRSRFAREATRIADSCQWLEDAAVDHASVKTWVQSRSSTSRLCRRSAQMRPSGSTRSLRPTWCRSSTSRHSPTLKRRWPLAPQPEVVVGTLAAKTPSKAYPNVHHRDLILSELAGQPVPMSGQAVINAGKVRQGPDGRLGVHVEHFTEQAALLRWQQHEFLDLERQIARLACRAGRPRPPRPDRRSSEHPARRPEDRRPASGEGVR